MQYVPVLISAGGNWSANELEWMATRFFSPSRILFTLQRASTSALSLARQVTQKMSSFASMATPFFFAAEEEDDDDDDDVEDDDDDEAETLRFLAASCAEAAENDADAIESRDCTETLFENRSLLRHSLAHKSALTKRALALKSTGPSFADKLGADRSRRGRPVQRCSRTKCLD